MTKDFYIIKIPARFQTFLLPNICSRFLKSSEDDSTCSIPTFLLPNICSRFLILDDSYDSNFFLSVLFLNPNLTFTPVLRMRIRMDLDHFGKLDPDPHQREKAGSGSAPK
jgi:hypothetical protein